MKVGKKEKATAEKRDFVSALSHRTPEDDCRSSTRGTDTHRLSHPLTHRTLLPLSGNIVLLESDISPGDRVSHEKKGHQNAFFLTPQAVVRRGSRQRRGKVNKNQGTADRSCAVQWTETEDACSTCTKTTRLGVENCLSPLPLRVKFFCSTCDPRVSVANEEEAAASHPTAVVCSDLSLALSPPTAVYFSRVHEGLRMCFSSCSDHGHDPDTALRRSAEAAVNHQPDS